MSDTDRLAELLHAEWDWYRACEPSEPGAPCHDCLASATRLLAAGVTLAPTPPDALREAAERVIRAVDAYRDAVNGLGHASEPHDQVIHMEPCCAGSPEMHVYSNSTDCAACGGSEYGTEAELMTAHGDLRVALGGSRLPWE